MLAHQITITPNKTYKTRETAIAAVDKLFAKLNHSNDILRYTILQWTDGRYYPVFIGIKAAEHNIHFHFNVVG